jgi:hypothetical protein
MNVPQIKQRLAELKSITGASDRTGWMVDEVALLMYTLVKYYKPGVVIQIGHLWGKSALFLLEALTDTFLTENERIEEQPVSGDKKFLAFVDSNRPAQRKGRLISVDAFPYGNWEQGIEFLKRTYGEDRFTYIVEKSTDYFEKSGEDLRKQCAGEPTFAIIDGDHSYAMCLSDMEAMASIGIDHMVIDDTKWLPHIGYLSEVFVRTHPQYQLASFGAYNGIALISKRGL